MGGIWRTSTWLSRGILVLAVAAAGVFVTESTASAATRTVYVRGSVTCPAGEPFAGAWVQSSSGGSGFASKTVIVETAGRAARIGRALESVAVPTTVSINVGCGGSASQWKYVFNGLGKVKATDAGTVFIKVICTTAGCATAPRGLAGSTTYNPATEAGSASTLYGKEWCTYRAAEFWKQMTGSYPSWSGNAGVWDDNAPARGWSTRSFPEPDSLMVWQPSSGGVGHAGYVADLKNDAGVRKVKIYDRNWDNKPYNGSLFDRNGEWISIPSGASFIRVPPRFTPYNR